VIDKGISMKRNIWKLNIKSKAGMTLVEVLVAIALFAVVALPLFGMFSNSMRLERRALVESLTTYTAQMKMEEAYGRPAESEEGNGILDVYNTDGRQIYPDDSIALYYEFSSDWDTTATSLIKVTVTVGSEYFDVETTLESLIKPVG